MAADLCVTPFLCPRGYYHSLSGSGHLRSEQGVMVDGGHDGDHNGGLVTKVKRCPHQGPDHSSASAWILRNILRTRGRCNLYLITLVGIAVDVLQVLVPSPTAS